MSESQDLVKADEPTLTAHKHAMYYSSCELHPHALPHVLPHASFSVIYFSVYSAQYLQQIISGPKEALAVFCSCTLGSRYMMVVQPWCVCIKIPLAEFCV